MFLYGRPKTTLTERQRVPIQNRPTPLLLQVWEHVAASWLFPGTFGLELPHQVHNRQRRIVCNEVALDGAGIGGIQSSRVSC